MAIVEGRGVRQSRAEQATSERDLLEERLLMEKFNVVFAEVERLEAEVLRLDFEIKAALRANDEATANTLRETWRALRVDWLVAKAGADALDARLEEIDGDPEITISVPSDEELSRTRPAADMSN